MKKMEESSKIEEKPPKKSYIGIFVLIAAVALGVYLIYSFVNFSPGFEYRGITGNVVKEGNIIFYKTSLPVVYQGNEQDYFFYLRNEPKELDKIPFDGKIEFTKNLVIQSPDEYELACNGYGTIGIMQITTFFNLMGAEVGKDTDAICVGNGEYTLLTLKKGNETRIDQVGPSCYDIQVKDCEILEATEKFLLEGLIEANTYK